MNAQPQAHTVTPLGPTVDPESLETEREAADFLGVTTRALQKWRVTGTGPSFVRISGRCVRYRRRDLVAWVEARLRSSTVEG
jgi:predicted DNA-binding transcriptional regulator AlpA